MIELETDDARALLDLGFVALSYGFYEQASAIFLGVQAARPSHEAGYLGSALVQLARGDASAAVKILRGLPPSDAVRAYLGMALVRHGNVVEARDILSDVVLTAPASPYAQFAAAILGEVSEQPRPLLP
jgi:Tetratricopeptide repeat